MAWRNAVAVMLALVLPSAAAAQRVGWDASVGAGSDAWRAAAAALWRVEVASRLSLGAGARLTYYAGSARSYTNRGEVTTGLPSALDVDPEVWGLNLYVQGELGIAGPLHAGANIDLAGVALGPSRTAGPATLEPARGSVLLWGTNDRGSLNSEFFVGLDVAPGVQVRAGASHYVTGYRAELGAERTRYQRFETVPFVGVRWSP